MPLDRAYMKQRLGIKFNGFDGCCGFAEVVGFSSLIIQEKSTSHLWKLVCEMTMFSDCPDSDKTGRYATSYQNKHLMACWNSSPSYYKKYAKNFSAFIEFLEKAGWEVHVGSPEKGGSGAHGGFLTYAIITPEKWKKFTTKIRRQKTE
jgi:hypothetical protein